VYFHKHLHKKNPPGDGRQDEEDRTRESEQSSS
jgi:hypothetical protein